MAKGRVSAKLRESKVGIYVTQTSTLNMVAECLSLGIAYSTPACRLLISAAAAVSHFDVRSFRSLHPAIKMVKFTVANHCSCTFDQKILLFVRPDALTQSSRNLLK